MYYLWTFQLSKVIEPKIANGLPDVNEIRQYGGDDNKRTVFEELKDDDWRRNYYFVDRGGPQSEKP